MYQAIREELEERPGVIVMDGKYPKSRTRGTARRGRTRQAAKSLDMATDRLDGRRQSQKMRFARAEATRRCPRYFRAKYRQARKSRVGR